MLGCHVFAKQFNLLGIDRSGPGKRRFVVEFSMIVEFGDGCVPQSLAHAGGRERWGQGVGVLRIGYRGLSSRTANSGRVRASLRGEADRY